MCIPYFLGFSVISRGSIAVDATGHAIIAGGILLPELPVVNGFQPKHGSRLPDGTWVQGPIMNGDVLKLNEEGSGVLYSTYIGGNGSYQADMGSSMIADDAGNVCLAGQTYSTNFPTKNAFQTSEDLNDRVFANAAFLMKLDTLHNPAPPPPDPKTDPAEACA